jgi:aminomethyltransferase
MHETTPIVEAFALLAATEMAGSSLPAGAADPQAGWRAAREGGLLVQHLERRLVGLRGPDAAEYLQRLGSREVEDLEPGQGRVSTVLTGKGKLIAHFIVWRVEAERWLLEVQAEMAEALHGFLDQFHFAEAFELQPPSAEQVLVGLIGPDAGAAGAPWSCSASGQGLELRSDELGQPSRRFLGSAEAAAAWIAAEQGEGRVLGGLAELEGLRIEAGWPRWGLDADSKSIPLELGLDEACSITKGCYPGQEVIARIHTYGHVNRSLVRVRFASAELPELGAAILDDGMQAGRLTSVCQVPGEERCLGLAMLPLGAIEEGEELRVGSEDGPLVEIVGRPQPD